VALTLLLTGGPIGAPAVASAQPTAITPIQHLVVIFQENESFDHYFGTYPVATNPAGEDPFTALPGTPSVNGLTTALLNSNPNGANPVRLDPGPNANGVYNATLNIGGVTNSGIDNTLTCSQNHNYMPEENAFDAGLMDKFPGNVGTGTGNVPEGAAAGTCNANTDLDYYDGNTVTAYWNYAQHFAMSDNSFGTGFGPSTPGAIEAISGDTGGVNVATPSLAGDTSLVSDAQGGFSDINDGDPYYDDCSSTTSNFGLSGENVGDLLNKAGLSWGWFEGGFTANSAYSGPANGAANPYNQASVTGRATCTTTHPIGAALGGTGSTGAQPYGTKADYIQHHEPFQYYPNTANPHHIAPTSLAAIGTDTQSFSGNSYGVGTPEFNTANHQYDISYFNTLVADIAEGSQPASLLPAVSYLKAPAYEDEHPANSDPVDGQHFVTQEINALEQTPDWPNTAVIVAYDDSDGWYDHVYADSESPAPAAQNQSSSNGDTLTPPLCGGTPITGTAVTAPVAIAASNQTITYTIGGGATQTATIPVKSYTTLASLATAISTASNASSIPQITAQANSAGDLVLTGNGLQSLAITGGTALSTLGLSTASSTPASPTLDNATSQPQNGRCGFGPRLPFMVISPWAKANFVDHNFSDQASIPNFIEYNWQLGTIPGSADTELTNATTSFDISNMFNFGTGGGQNPVLFLDPTTFQPTSTPIPLVPETHFPVLFVISGLVLFGGAALVLGRRQLHHRGAKA